MNQPPRQVERLVFLTVGAGIGVYTLAESDPLFALLVGTVWALAWPVRFSKHGRPLPRAVLSLIVVAALAYAVLRTLGDIQNLVTSVSRLIIWLQIALLYDRWQVRERGVLLVTSAFLAVGAVLTSNDLLLGMSMLVYLPLLLWASLLHQLSGIEERVTGRASTMRQPSERRRKDLVRLSVAVVFGAAVTATGVFLLIPRGVGEGFLGDWGAPTEARVSGFSETVTLGDAGLISESRTPVLEVVLRDASGRNIGSANRPLLLRGAVLEEYRDGRWSRSDDRGDRYRLGPGQTANLTTNTPRGSMRTLDVTIRSRPGDHLFTALSPVSLTVDRGAELLVGPENLEVRASSGVQRYTVRFQDSQVARPDTREPATGGIASERIAELAARLVAEAGLETDPAERDADADEAALRSLVDYLHRNYFYTTVMTAADSGEDPIEMFLFRTREGHCEYFASGLAAMSRSIGVAARVVTGYLAVEFDDALGAYIVRESNAHAWVEARLSDGRWVSLDPSPPDDLATIHTPPTGFTWAVRGAWERVTRWWVERVVAFNEDRRRAMVGRDPLRIERALEEAVSNAFMPTEAGGRPIVLIALVRGVMVFAIVAAVGFAGVQFTIMFSGMIAARRRRVREAGSDPEAPIRAQQQGFYHATLRALRKAGLGKPPGRGMKDHARDLAGVDLSLAESLDEIADVYYASRFGRIMLTEEEHARGAAGLERVRTRLDEVRRSRRSGAARVR